MEYEMPQPKTFHEGAHKAADIIADLVTAKQHDYGPNNILGFGEMGVLVRLWDKVNRLKNLLWDKKTEPRNESVEDTWKDIAGYAIIALMLKRGWFTLPLKEE